METEKTANEQTRHGLTFEKKNEYRIGIFVKPRGEFLKYVNWLPDEKKYIEFSNRIYFFSCGRTLYDETEKFKSWETSVVIIYS